MNEMIEGRPAHGLAHPFCRQDELRDILNIVGAEECRAVFVASEPGLGATTLLRAVSDHVGAYAPVLEIHGTPSLANVPYGVLAPFLRGVTMGGLPSGIPVLRALLAAIADKGAGHHAGTARPALLIIDDADAIDQATAELVTSLVMSGSASLVASHRTADSLVEPLPQMWHKGMAEALELQPLSHEQGHEFCVQMLGGPVLATSSWHFWSASAGNPLLMHLLVAEAAESGRLVRTKGMWVAERLEHPRGRVLTDVVRQRLRGLSAKARQALNLVALTEPVERATIEELLGADAVGELADRRLVRDPDAGASLLRLANPLYGEVIRDMVPKAQSLMLHRQLIERLDTDGYVPEALLRRVTWALDSGATVPDEKLLRAAVLACKLFQAPVALRLVGAISGDEYGLRAQMVKARVRYNMGDYAEAARLLDGGAREARSVAELLFGSLLRAATRSALGQPAAMIGQDAAELRLAGEHLAAAEPEHAAETLMLTGERADLLDIMALSRDGRYAQMEPLLAGLFAAEPRPKDPEYLLNLSVALAMDAERLSAMGRPVRGQGQAAAAFEIVHSEDHDVFFLPEMIISRSQAAALCAGDWSDSEEILQSVAVDTGPAVVSFGGSANVVRGLVTMRQGLRQASLDDLLPGIEALRISDPQQLLGFCTAMAFSTAAAAGKAELAAKLSSDYCEGHGMYLVTAHERAFMAAGREYLAHDGGGLAELLRQADEAAAQGCLTIELNALMLAYELGAADLAPRLRAVAAGMEGAWAQAVAGYVDAMMSGDAEVLVRTGQALREGGLLRFAEQAFSAALPIAAETRAGVLAHEARRHLAAIREELGIETAPGPASVGNPEHKPAATLTRREHEIATLAGAGKSDKEIAAALHLSVRTVEGHLYRCYAKLGISRRDEISAVYPEPGAGRAADHVVRSETK
ncbi:helix-turn-helix transcriptional regulator [Specibacter cremeus]|uniref:helix-turn-helix transcriptional regulator n=1 Tax=Specibacter cremeus TaxID=1629051 RepID=UPI000F78EA21|nr:LuxR C-terminal-related transcriptional regulator [Specibacter cremeus]